MPSFMPSRHRALPLKTGIALLAGLGMAALTASAAQAQVFSDTSSRPKDSEVDASGMGADRKFGPKNPGSEPASVLPGKVSVEEET